MILVDTSVWIDHLHRSDTRLVEALDSDDVGQHPSVIEELALGSVNDRRGFLALLANLRLFPVLSHGEAMVLVEEHRLWGRGLSAIDAHLLGSVLITPSARLWTRDRRLRSFAGEIGIGLL